MRLRLPLFILGITVALILITSDASAHPASGIVRDRAGNIYFSDLETVWKIDTADKLSVFRPGVNGRHVHELAIDDQDNIYGADISYESQKWISAVWKMTPDGSFQFLLKPTDNPPRGMSIWRDREGNNYFVDQNNHTKTQTLLLRRTPAGQVTTLAGGAYGHADGKGTAARFSSVGNVAFGPDGSLYLSDGSTVRKVAMDGTVVTVAANLDARTKDDKPTLFGGSYGQLSGLAVDAEENVFVADAGNRRLFKIDRKGKAEVLLRSDPPYFPNGVAIGASGELYVLEVGFTLPGSWSGPRVRKITADGKSIVLATIGAENDGRNLKASVARHAGASAESFLSFFLIGDRIKYCILILSAGILCTGAVVWQRRKRQRV
jgi:sugar lactone lactonase YvrE